LKHKFTNLGIVSGAIVTIVSNGTDMVAMTTASGEVSFNLEDQGLVDIQIESDSHTTTRQNLEVRSSTTITCYLSTKSTPTQYQVRYDPVRETLSDPVSIDDTSAVSGIPNLVANPSSVDLSTIYSDSRNSYFTFTLTNTGNLIPGNKF
jgi:hypothetical protein